MTILIAVTACPTGVAHTYMAAEALQTAAQKKGWSIKVETQGASGIENELNSADIENADMVILTNDISIKNEGRFNHKKIVRVGSNTAVRHADKIMVKIAENLGIE
ncbi:MULTISPECIES: PTS fructose-like transporter subunit IIB [Hafnia]|jgi:fructose-specific phosphotransferase system IIB component|uniref:protein-N(pi)-phosphohistidine--D-fructose phosphotransferase n=1 Tax=Hafnia paralvei TaxID=546367 RepID=A0A2A2MCF3_9GAMM|nr:MULTISPECIES: PTS fructose-like transporter subunit IIB [Hafnia]KHS47898.1 PTS fructose transporter subunit IIB [Hafnia paralvei]MCE9882508.1 PTS fructose-like transporter subunit IIB [Hafnia paralvei]MCE9908479.1 PTS fructose-like transporter subunit IIB [Hafnia paralvei]MCE9912440.1 PTS fructose-like transporter subunit IIB [Hafnia paralvei]MCK2181746.1 PTS fructose-like transporter subunit IIB [Hafnia paralvei]